MATRLLGHAALTLAVVGIVGVGAALADIDKAGKPPPQPPNRCLKWGTPVIIGASISDGPAHEIGKAGSVEVSGIRKGMEGQCNQVWMGLVITSSDPTQSPVYASFPTGTAVLVKKTVLPAAFFAAGATITVQLKDNGPHDPILQTVTLRPTTQTYVTTVGATAPTTVVAP